MTKVICASLRISIYLVAINAVVFLSNSVSEQQAKYCLSKMDFAKMGAISATLIRARFAASIAGIPRESALVRLRPEY